MMLVLSRKIGESIQIGEAVTVTIVAIKGNKIRVGIDAPQTVAILREELVNESAKSARVTIAAPRSSLF